MRKSERECDSSNDFKKMEHSVTQKNPSRKKHNKIKYGQYNSL